MHSKKIIEPAQSELTSPMVFAPKNNGSLHFSLDYMNLNAVIVKDAYQIQQMDDCLY